jgi:hypothetical protein
VKDATTKSTLKLFNFEEFEIGKIHNIWKSCGSDLYASCLKAILYSIDPLFSAIFLNKESIRLWSSASIGICPAIISTAAVDVRTGRC